MLVEPDNDTDPPDYSRQSGARWDFAAVDAAADPQSFVRYLKQRHPDSVDFRRGLSYELLDVREGQRLLDVGCGLGDDVRALARLVGASGSVVGLDQSERLLEVARRRSDGFASPHSFVHADMHHLPFAAASFDGCRAERVLLHTARPLEVLEEMRRVTRPGGRIVVSEPDLDTLIFHASSQVAVRKLTQWHSDGVRNGAIGRWLPEIFRQCGLQDIQVVPTVTYTAELSNYPQTLAQRAQEAGVLTQDEAQDLTVEWQRRAERHEYLEFGVFFTVAGRVAD
jgi:ubiquinone/menaquinone biosynthesis C-methylase UbiE